MNLSVKWLNDYVKLHVEPRDFSEKMSLSGSKVEGFEIEGEKIQNIVVGKILSVRLHPDADKLVVCMLAVGKPEPLQIVTGAKNVKPDDLVPVALHKSVLADGTEIKKGKLRGELSEGMLCSLEELGLTKNDFPYADEDGIFLLQEPCEIGQDIKDVLGLGDICVEFEITPNRPDCLSIIGLAREVAVTYNKELTLPQPKIQKESGNINDYLSVSVQNEKLCPRYVARMVKNIKIEPSPRWMRERLRASGVRPINNIVDITNFVMLEYGQPMHAFDYRYVKEGKIIVRNAKENESITTLDGVKRKLSPEMLVIADAESPSAIAGIMGGEYSGIMHDTNTIIFESAMFENVSVRTSSKKLGLRTESSSRFEKGLDAQNCIPAVTRACELVELLGAGEIVGGTIDVNSTNYSPTKIAFEPDWINEFIGISLSKDRMIDILTDLGFGYQDGEVLVPSYRQDVEHKADISEEIARIYGYDKIASTAIRGVAQASITPQQKFEQLLSQTLLSQGCFEISTYSFISPKFYDKILLSPDDPKRNSLKILNPLGEDTSIMRTIAIPSMMEILSKNYNNRNLSARLFEIAKEYIPVQNQEQPDEKQVVLIGLYGPREDFYSLKGIVENLFSVLGISSAEFSSNLSLPYYHPGRNAGIYLDGNLVGTMGEMHPQVQENYEIDTRVYLASLDCDALFAGQKEQKQYTALPKFPATTRDIALLCDEDLPVGEIEKAIRASSGSLLEDLELFDIYRGEQIPQNKKSVAYNMTFRSSEKTLSEEEIEKVFKKIVDNLSKIGAQIRG